MYGSQCVWLEPACECMLAALFSWVVMVVGRQHAQRTQHCVFWHGMQSGIQGRARNLTEVRQRSSFAAHNIPYLSAVKQSQPAPSPQQRCCVHCNVQLQQSSESTCTRNCQTCRLAADPEQPASHPALQLLPITSQHAAAYASHPCGGFACC